jgi:hypothetical protein
VLCTSPNRQYEDMEEQKLGDIRFLRSLDISGGGQSFGKMARWVVRTVGPLGSFTQLSLPFVSLVSNPKKNVVCESLDYIC